ncbi:MAG TPA: beta-L-arabinofuranosidase domain-containing protein, partial [Cyclobacteriaceae bacterium]|nr:beta-L-arabinofuranosidase domain-containing protein [Cyclobacteriaceae bacterium]
MIKNVILACAIVLVAVVNVLAQGDYPIQPVLFTSVELTDDFWAPKIKTNHAVTIPIAMYRNESSGRVKNFAIAGGLAEGKFQTQMVFDDSDIYKMIEAASYSLQTNPDKKLAAKLDSLIALIAAAQEPDGYIYTNRTIANRNKTKPHAWAGDQRWINEHDDSHELYVMGHLYEAAVAHYQATGKRNFLDIAIKSADLVDKDFGWDAIASVPGHQVIEMGLVRLYNVTHEKRYLDLAKFFLDARGTKSNEYLKKKNADREHPLGNWPLEYYQRHKDVVDQREAVGHAVRATYMYSGMADIAVLYNNDQYIKAIKSIWEDVVFKKMYITGGIGVGGHSEGFAGPYHLPNMSAYCETCASVGNIFWNYRMFLYDGDSKYLDVLERSLYNALLSGVSISGDRFFYPNVLESFGQHQRGEWFGTACCPPNVARLLPSFPGYMYATKDASVYVNFYADNTASVELKKTKVELVQKTKYPWEGSINLTVNP